MFSGKNVPAGGASLGVERGFSILEDQARAKNELLRTTQTEVLVASIGPNLLIKRMQLCTRLWSAGIKADFVLQHKPNMDKQLMSALEEGVPLVVIFGEEELSQGIINMDLKTQENSKAEELVEELKRRLRAQ